MATTFQRQNIRGDLRFRPIILILCKVLSSCISCYVDFSFCPFNPRPLGSIQLKPTPPPHFIAHIREPFMSESETVLIPFELIWDRFGFRRIDLVFYTNP